MLKKTEFGGQWTEEKLARVAKYLSAYMTILKKRQQYSTFYIDAFASSGSRAVVTSAGLFDEDTDADIKELTAFHDGSTRKALEATPRFDHYVFVELRKDKAAKLESLKLEFPDRADSIQVVNDDANAYLNRWCSETDWSKSRAVIFLDPFGMEIDWSTLEAIGLTKAVDLWLLVPIMAVNRLLTKTTQPQKSWEDRLTRFFGTTEWKESFYSESIEMNLFGEVEIRVTKDADFSKIKQFTLNRLHSIFAGVADNPLVLKNSRNSPLFLLCFAVGNPFASETALKIAQYILKRG